MRAVVSNAAAHANDIRETIELITEVMVDVIEAERVDGADHDETVLTALKKLRHAQITLTSTANELEQSAGAS